MLRGMRDVVVRSWFAFVVTIGACSDSTVPHAPDSGSIDASADSPPGARKRIFTSLAAPLGNFYNQDGGGIAQGDRTCTESAGLAGIAGTFTAWLSSPGANAIDRIADVGPWYLIDGTTLVFQTKAELLSGPRVAILRNEHNEPVPPGAEDTFVWTGTTATGTASTDTCASWTDDNAVGTIGRADRTDATWTQADVRMCSAYVHLYCFEQ
jgi:hypothetical protein